MTEIEQLLAREAIKETKARYCRFLDTKCWDDWGSVFTEDAKMDVSDDVKDIPGASSHIQGRDTLVNQTRELVGPGNHMHHVHSPEITFISNNEAQVIWAMEDWVNFPEGVPGPFQTMNAFGHYYETYKREGSVWRISTLKLKRIHQTITPKT